MLIRLGYTEPVADSASGFVRNFDYGGWLNAHDTSATRWQHVASVRPPILAIPVGAIVLSLRNVRLGRSDTRGATRLAAVTGGLAFAAATAGSHFSGDFGLNQLWLLAGWGTSSALLVWTFYAALEPYVRRRWPEMLISWSRLLDGRWRDPLVGRDLLVGSAIGVGVTLMQPLQGLVLEWRGAPPALNTVTTGIWEGIRPVVADLPAIIPTSAGVSLGVVMFLVLLRPVLRGERAAAIGAIVLLFPFFLVFGTADPLVFAAVAAIRACVWVAVVTRFGLVMFAALVMAVPTLGQLGGGLAAPGFALGAVVLTMALPIALGVFGFVTATRGHKMTAWLEE